ncbi:hypothetical protein [Methylophaga lonarensis]|uniref:hypothetical protein n=1 Tax=Methylophaga lonarensis TaxID=999151 RepID=UPI003D2D9DFF
MTQFYDLTRDLGKLRELSNISHQGRACNICKQHPDLDDANQPPPGPPPQQPPYRHQYPAPLPVAQTPPDVDTPAAHTTDCKHPRVLSTGLHTHPQQD